MKDFFNNMLSGPDGDISAKRVTAFALVLAGIAYAFIGLAIGKPDPTTVGVLIGGGTGILIGAAVSHT